MSPPLLLQGHGDGEHYREPVDGDIQPTEGRNSETCFALQGPALRD